MEIRDVGEKTWGGIKGFFGVILIFIGFIFLVVFIFIGWVLFLPLLIMLVLFVGGYKLMGKDIGYIEVMSDEKK